MLKRDLSGNIRAKKKYMPGHEAASSQSTEAQQKIAPLSAQFRYDEALGFICEGDWVIMGLDALLQAFQAPNLPKEKKICIDGSNIGQFDSAGALLLMQWIDFFHSHEKETQLLHFSESQKELLKLVKERQDEISVAQITPQPKKRNIFYKLGKVAVERFEQAFGFLKLFNILIHHLGQIFKDRRHFHIDSMVSNMYVTGVLALPILALLAFLIGIVLAYQLGVQLENYGATAFIAYLSGMAIFREFGPLITAIIVAGRTSSAFTSQIGSMKINEEIDALKAFGLSPMAFLILPKVLGLIIVFPFLIFWANCFSLLGAMCMSKWILHNTFSDFLMSLKESVGFNQMLLGLYKAPVFALLTSMVGCYEGLQVESSAQDIGKRTTKSVVQALFLIIVTDACFSIVYSWLDL